MIGSRMSADAIAVVVGVACGVLANVPTSLLMIWGLRYRQQERSEGRDQTPQTAGARYYPPVVVVNPGTGHTGSHYGLPGLPPPPPYPPEGHLISAGQRAFRVMGDE